ncbi:MAG: hydantoinase B/oxoprolinase family protein, partial [Natronomonas sp.]
MTLDAVSLEVLRNQLTGIAEEMGHVLIHGAYSPNIKERQDGSTALFDASGRMIAQAEHIPVHLGAMPEAVDAIRERDPAPGEAYMLNDPFAGGTHLPDVTIVAPIDIDGDIVGYGVTRAHHGDVGGMTPGSMPAGATEIYQEGLRIPTVRLANDGELDEDILSLL